MNLAYVLNSEPGVSDKLLTEFAALCKTQGRDLAGLVQTNTPRPKTHHCDMDVTVLPNGPILRISQDLGPNARGCRLDPSVLESAVDTVLRDIGRQPDLLVINKFGKHEAEGRGFREVIGEYLANDVPVIVGINPLNLDAFNEFSEGLAQKLPANVPALTDWLGDVSTRHSEAA